MWMMNSGISQPEGRKKQNKLLRSLVVQWILLYLIPDWGRVNRLWLGRELSFRILGALNRHLTLPILLILVDVFQ